MAIYVRTEMATFCLFEFLYFILPSPPKSNESVSGITFIPPSKTIINHEQAPS